MVFIGRHYHIYWPLKFIRDNSKLSILTDDIDANPKKQGISQLPQVSHMRRITWRSQSLWVGCSVVCPIIPRINRARTVTAVHRIYVSARLRQRHWKCHLNNIAVSTGLDRSFILTSIVFWSWKILQLVETVLFHVSWKWRMSLSW